MTKKEFWTKTVDQWLGSFPREALVGLATVIEEEYEAEIWKGAKSEDLIAFIIHHAGYPKLAHALFEMSVDLMVLDLGIDQIELVELEIHPQNPELN